MPRNIEFESNRSEITPSLTPNQQWFDLSQESERARLNNHLVKQEVRLENKPFQLTFWVERDAQGKITTCQQIREIDIRGSQLERAFLLLNPHLVFPIKKGDQKALQAMQNFIQKNQESYQGTAYLDPVEHVLIYGAEPETDELLRTASNRGLISLQEQEILRNYRVGFFGLSVGNLALRTWQNEADSETIFGGDPDIVELSNLNRLMVGRAGIGRNKAIIAMEQAKSHNPFVQTGLSENGLCLPQNDQGIDEVTQFLREKYAFLTPEMIDLLPENQISPIIESIAQILIKPENFGTVLSNTDALVDVMDNLRMKMLLRLAAKKLGKPVLMVSDMGDTVVLDVERYDLEKDTGIFFGNLDKGTILKFLIAPSSELFAQVAQQIVGKDMTPKDFQIALSQMGEKLISPPQLASTIAIAAGILTKQLRRMALGQSNTSLRQRSDF